MNRILGKKKLADDKAAKDGRGWRKQKKLLPEATKSQVDLSNALPALDDFRTSLIMPNLSARFSMLREQDDPASKIGKASDDSVLTPRRKSRLHDFDLDLRTTKSREILEPVTSKPSVERPWLPAKQHDSFVSDQSGGSDTNSDPSMMNRARPTDGNVLFGGRQKVYRLPSSGHSKTNGLGKVLYGNDLTLSPYQRQRQDPTTTLAASTIDLELHTDTESISIGSAKVQQPDTVSLGASLPADDTQPMRKTSASLRSQRSGDSSVPSQTHSTAPTSIHSQPPPVTSATQSPTPAMPKPLGIPERSLTKRRLYEQGLDQHMLEQQTNALTRLNSVHRQQNRSKSPPAALNAKAFGTMPDPGMPGSGGSRPQSPSTLHPLHAFGSLRASASASSTPTTNPQSPTFFPHAEHDEYNMLAATVAPGDRGKATAMGAFNKPKQKFDEEQYLQRLQQLQATLTASDTPQTDDPIDNSQTVADVPTTSDAPPSSTEKMSPSQMSERAFAVFQSAASAMRSVQSSPNPNFSPDPSGSGVDEANKSFTPARDDQSRAAIDSPQDSGKDYSPTVSAARQFHLPYIPAQTSEHQSQRTPPTVFPEIQEEDEDDVSAIGSRHSQYDSAPIYKKPQALGGLVHQHLRNSSEQSSIGTAHQRNASSQSSVYYASSHRRSDMNLDDDPTLDTPRQTDNRHTNSNPWDIDDFASSYYYEKRRSAREDQTRRQVPDVGKAVPAAPPGDAPAWHSELKLQHTREASSGTIQEREAFANELAARQKAIQAKMKGITEVESRAASPMPAASGASKALNMLRSVSSREVMTKHEPQREQQPKAMKLLGLSTTNLNPHPEVDDADSQRRPSVEPSQAKTRQAAPMYGSRSRGDSESSIVGPPRLVPTGSTSQSRARSNSVASGAGDRQRAEPNGAGSDGALRTNIPSGVRTVQARRSPLAADDASRSPGKIDSQFSRTAASNNSDLLLSPISTRMGARSASGPATINSASASPSSPYSGISSGLDSPKEYGVSVVTPHHPHIKSSANAHKRRNVTKFDISEPVLISSTSNVETVDLPAGASLRNGDSLPAQHSTNKPRRQRTLRIFQRFGHDGASDVEHDSMPKQTRPAPQLLSSNGQYSATQGASPVSPYESAETSPVGHMPSPQVSSPRPSAPSSRKTSVGGQVTMGPSETLVGPEKKETARVVSGPQPAIAYEAMTNKDSSEGGMF